LVATFFTNFDPQIEVVPTKGKTAPSDDPLLTKIRHLPEVDVATESVEDQLMHVGLIK
jgi:lipoprotein-releasing system permease protein